MKRTCTKCKKTKPLSEFYKSRLGKSGFRADCKTCHKKRCLKYRKLHKTKAAEYNRKYKRTLAGNLRIRFTQMRHRCNNSRNSEYKNYGGRGIRCLFKNADEFVDYVINKLQVDPFGLTIDRIDNDGNYEPGNIRFVTHKENCNNRRKKDG